MGILESVNTQSQKNYGGSSHLVLTEFRMGMLMGMVWMHSKLLPGSRVLDAHLLETASRAVHEKDSEGYRKMYKNLVSKGQAVSNDVRSR
jgi:hypothetical protein